MLGPKVDKVVKPVGATFILNSPLLIAMVSTLLIGAFAKKLLFEINCVLAAPLMARLFKFNIPAFVKIAPCFKVRSALSVVVASFDIVK